jgi:plastocyanin
VAVTGLGLIVAAGASTMATKLNATTGPGFTITMKKGTSMVKKLKPGKYTLTVRDKSSIHNFRLKGPGLNKQITTVPFVGTKTISVTLKKGKYTYDCDPHYSLMHHSFVVS